MNCLIDLPQEAAEAPKLAEAQAAPMGGDVKTFTMEEVEKHDTRDSAWFVHAGQVGTCGFTRTYCFTKRQSPFKCRLTCYGEGVYGTFLQGNM